MKRILICLICLIYITACTDIQDDLKGDAVINGRLTYRDLFNGTGEEKPVSQGKVYISYTPGDSVNYIYYTQTDDAGNFTFKRLEKGREYLLFYHDTIGNTGYSLYSKLTVGENNEIRVVAENDQKDQQALAITVVDEQGEALKGLEIGLFNNKEIFGADSTNKQAIDTETTDGYGRVVFYHLKGGTYYTRALGSSPIGKLYGDSTYSYSGDGIQSVSLTVKTNRNINNVLTIRFMDEAGNPLPKISGCLFNNILLFNQEHCGGSMQTITSSDNGAIKMENLPHGAYYLYADTLLNNVRYRGKLLFTVAAGADTVDIVLKKILSSELRVKVTDEAGLPIPGINVCSFNNPLYFNTESCNNSSDRMTTQVDGVAVFPAVPLGSYYLYASTQVNQKDYKGKATITVNATGTTNVTLVLKKVLPDYELEITTKDRASTPVNKAHLYFFSSRVLFEADTTEGAVFDAETGPDGKLLLTQEQPGYYYIRARVTVGGQVVMRGADSVNIVPSPVKTFKTVWLQ